MCIQIHNMMVIKLITVTKVQKSINIRSVGDTHIGISNCNKRFKTASVLEAISSESKIFPVGKNQSLLNKRQFLMNVVRGF